VRPYLTIQFCLFFKQIQFFVWTIQIKHKCKNYIYFVHTKPHPFQCNVIKNFKKKISCNKYLSSSLIINTYSFFFEQQTKCVIIYICVRVYKKSKSTSSTRPTHGISTKSTQLKPTTMPLNYLRL
jgi:hypothetical protein